MDLSDTFMNALPAHVAVDHNHKHFDNESSEYDQIAEFPYYCYFY